MERHASLNRDQTYHFWPCWRVNLDDNSGMLEDNLMVRTGKILLLSSFRRTCSNSGSSVEYILQGLHCKRLQGWASKSSKGVFFDPPEGWDHFYTLWQSAACDLSVGHETRVFRKEVYDRAPKTSCRPRHGFLSSWTA